MTFCPPSGLHKWLRMPQGAHTTPECSQRFIKRVTTGLLGHILVYEYVAGACDASPTAHIPTLGEFLSCLPTRDTKSSSP